MQIHREIVWAWRAVDLASAAKRSAGRREGTNEGTLAVGLGVANKCCPVFLTKPFAHAAFETNARLFLGEKGAPTLASTVVA